MTSETRFSAADLAPSSWLEIANPALPLGKVRQALFDFDGTISVIRRGWEAIMIPLMVEMICEGHPPPPDLEEDVARYVDQSTGILTIEQMRWLEQAVPRYGLAQHVKTAAEYKKIYNERLLEPVRRRLAEMNQRGGPSARDSFMIAGARDFIAGLHERGVILSLASGTDHQYVLEEATALGVEKYFGDRIYGARDDTEKYSKGQIIQRLLEESHLRGEELLVVGDGPVEIRLGKTWGAVTLGVAADEVQRQGLDAHKHRRLTNAGADLIVTDFLHHADLVQYFVGGRKTD